MRGAIGLAMFCSALAILLSVVTGCVGQPPPSSRQSICDPAREAVPDPVAKARPSHTTPHIFPIRLTDDGQYVSRCELTDALLELRAPGSHVAVVYIHGWKHNALPDDSDLENLQTLLNRLAAQEAQRPEHRRVVGVYIAWNGATLGAPGLDNLTFWGRKKAADLIAHSAIVTKIVSAVDGIEQKRRAADPRSTDVTIYAGHSFGARILYSAVSQVLIHNVEFAYPDTLQGRSSAAVNPALPPDTPYHRISGFGDLVLLLNPAFEASLYQSFETLVRPGGRNDPSVARERFAASQLPLLLTLSADNDWATGLAFPIGQIIALNANTVRRKTLGHYLPSQTHRLSVASTSGAGSSTATPSFWFDNFCAAQICLKRLPDVPETGDPFIVAQAPPDIIDGHNGIWKPQLQDFLVQFIDHVIEQRESASDP